MNNKALNSMKKTTFILLLVLVINQAFSQATAIPENASKWIDSELAKVKTKPIKDFNSSDFFNKANGRIVGYLNGYDVSLGFTTGFVYMGNVLTNEDFPIVVQIHPDGRFEADLPLIAPLNTYLVIDDNIIVPFYLEPEQTLGVYLDLDALLKKEAQGNKLLKLNEVFYVGALAKVNIDLLGFNLEPDYRVYDNKILTTQLPEEFKRDEQIMLQENLKQFLNYKSNHKSNQLEKQFKEVAISPKAATIIQNEILLESATRMFDFIMHSGDEARRDTTNAVLKVKENPSYYNFLKKMPLNNQSFLISNRFSLFINRFEFAKPLSIYPKLGKGYKHKTFLEYLKEAGVNITNEEQKLQKELRLNYANKTFLEKNKVQLENFNKKFKTDWDAYIEENDIEADEWYKSQKISMEKWRLRDSVLTNTLGLEKSLVYNITKLRVLKVDIERSSKEQAQDYWNRLKTQVKHPFLIEEGDRLVNEIFPDNNATSYVLPIGKETDVFKKIIDPFKGKILFIDFWATSCGPCVGGIKRMKETRKKYKNNKDFDFVFITDERSSPLNYYTKFVEEQELENIYRLSIDDYNYLRELFKFNGIPRYVVIDKKGNVINDDFAMYNFGSELPNILKKHSK